MYNYHKSLNLEPRTDSKRWNTTTALSMRETAEAISKIDRSALVNDLKERKINNTKTSINFGNEKIDYVSDMMDNQRRCMSNIDIKERNEQLQRNKIMKAELTQTSFSLGDDKPDYQSENHRQMAESLKFQGGRAHLFSDLKEAVKKSSITFGKEPVNYNSVAQEAMLYKGNPLNFEQIKKEIKDMTTTLRKHNFTLGDDRVEYVTDYQRFYKPLDKETYQQQTELKSNINKLKSDLRKNHFVLGHEKVNYVTDTQEALKLAEEFGTGSEKAQTYALEVQNNIRRAKEMKLALQKTSYVIGDDYEYR